MFDAGLAAMMPTLEKLLNIRRRVEDGETACRIAELAGMLGGPVARLDGCASGEPFVMFLVTPPVGEKKKSPNLLRSQNEVE